MLVLHIIVTFLYYFNVWKYLISHILIVVKLPCVIFIFTEVLTAARTCQGCGASDYYFFKLMCGSLAIILNM
jgi:hypothetical protein